ncbi:hypothetical protein [Aquimarina rhabdastrellae]
MRTSIIDKHIFFETSITQIGLLSELFRSKSSRFSRELENWLSQNEQGLKKLGYTESSRFSILRNQLFSLKLQTGSQQRRQQLVASGKCLEQGHDILSNLHEPIHIKVTQGKEVVLQILSLIHGLPEFSKTQKETFNSYIRRLWNTIKSNEQFKQVAVQLQSVLPEVDILRIIAEEIKL